MTNNINGSFHGYLCVERQMWKGERRRESEKERVKGWGEENELMKEA